jgi:Protein kinase domain/WD40-like Beta Propeller Repeat
MSLSPGTRISTYDVVAPIGEGGMGVVYRAHDTKLGRDVALKVLPEAFALDAERLARFEREARTLATLNHPNIAQVYDAGKESSGAYLVMELIEGDTLGEAIRAHHSSAPSSASSTADLIEWALPIAKQIVDARLDLDEAGAPGADAGMGSAAKDAERTAQLVAANAAELKRMSKKQKLGAGVASLVGVAALAALFWPRPQPAPPSRVAFSLEVPVAGGGSTFPAVSPDGQRLAYLSPREPGGPGVIFVRPLGGEEARPLAGSDGAGQLKWAPDSRSLAFVANGRVHVAQESGGLRRLAEVPDVAGLTWLPEGDVLAASNSYTGTGKLLRVPVQGGAAAELAMPRLDWRPCRRFFFSSSAPRRPALPVLRMVA